MRDARRRVCRDKDAQRLRTVPSFGEVYEKYSMLLASVLWYWTESPLVTQLIETLVTLAAGWCRGVVTVQVCPEGLVLTVTL